MTRVEVVIGRSMAAWNDRALEGERPDELPYGLHHLRAHGFEVAWRDPRVPRTRLGRRAGHLLSRLEARSGRLVGLPHGIALRRPLVASRRADVTLAIFEDQVLLLALLRRLRPRRAARGKLVVVSCWTAESARTVPRPVWRLVRWLLRTVDAWIVFSSSQVGPLAEALGIDECSVHAVPYGVDTRFYERRGLAREGCVAAVGLDVSRDFAVLAEAVRGTDIRVKLACPKRLLPPDIPANIEWLGQIDHLAYRDLLHGAAVSVVPVREVAYPGGQSVLIESMAAAVCTIVTATPSIAEYVEDDATAVLVPAGDPRALRAMIEGLLSDVVRRERIASAGHRAATERYDSRKMWAAIAPHLV